MKNNSIQKIKDYLDFKGISVRKAEIEIGATNGLLSRAIKKNTTVGNNIIENFLHNFSDINPEWLLTGKGEMLKQEASVSPIRNEARALPDYEMIPLPIVSVKAQAGYVSGYQDKEFLEQLPTILVSKQYEKGNYIVFEVEGDSMHPKIQNGDKVLTKEVDSLEIRENRINIKKYYYIIVTQREGVVCKIIKENDTENKKIKVQSINQAYKEYEIDGKDIKQILQVREIVNRLLIIDG